MPWRESKATDEHYQRGGLPAGTGVGGTVPEDIQDRLDDDPSAHR